ncbi:hypothetical protein [Photobacterium kishitanii]|uniref:hypothetical protein n=1 Tax=Photobacterium kishitanii TaxID=318456 RepID=UPI00273900D5|nr:hypothetical protein [Photobacterium kishitanii]
MIKNSLLSVFASLINAGLLFYVIPNIIGYSGGEVYGILASCLIILNLIPFLSLSVFYSLSSMLSRNKEKRKYIINSFIVIVIVTIFFDFLFLFFDGFFIRYLISSNVKYIDFYIYTIYIFSILMLSEVVRGVYAGYEKNYLYELLRIAYSIFFGDLLRSQMFIHGGMCYFSQLD